MERMGAASNPGTCRYGEWDVSGIYLLDFQHPDRCLRDAEQGAPSEGESAPAGTGVSCCVTHSRFLPRGPKTDELIGGVCFRAV